MSRVNVFLCTICMTLLLLVGAGIASEAKASVYDRWWGGFGSSVVGGLILGYLIGRAWSEEEKK